MLTVVPLQICHLGFKLVYPCALQHMFLQADAIYPAIILYLLLRLHADTLDLLSFASANSICL